MNNIDMIESMKAEMKEKENEFNNVLEQIKNLDAEYEMKRRQLDDAREQIRGAYTVLYMQLQKFGVENDITAKQTNNANNVDQNTTAAVTEVSSDINVDNAVQEVKTSNVEKKSSKVKAVKKDVEKNTSDVKKNNKLTADEKSKITEAIMGTSNNSFVDEKGNIVPDYLVPKI